MSRTEVDNVNVRYVFSWNERTKKAIFRVFSNSLIFGEMVETETPEEFEEKAMEYVKKLEVVLKEELVKNKNKREKK